MYNAYAKASQTEFSLVETITSYSLNRRDTNLKGERMKMAHLMKIGRQGLTHMLDHYVHKFDRDNIDKELIHLNKIYTFRDDAKTDKEFIEDRLSQLTYRQQKNNVLMCNWVITVPEDYHGNTDNFFRECFKFCGDRYGTENIVAGYVHRDEPTAREHIHIAFIPAYKDEHGIDRLSSNVVNRKDLQTFHKDLERYLERNHVHAHMLNGKTKENVERVKEQEYEIQYLSNHLAKFEPDFYSKMQKYVTKEMELDKAVREQDHTRDKERDKERDLEPVR